MVDDQTIRTVFDTCKGDIDSAVARLSALALASGSLLTLLQLPRAVYCRGARVA